jgi:preprotein translocase subunit SecE
LTAYVRHDIVLGNKARGAFLFDLAPMNGFISYLKNVRQELTHVVWPNWQTGVAHTALIIAISALVAVFIGVLDYLFTNLVSAIVGA